MSPYVIMTKDGWRPLLPAMQPAPPLPKFGHFPGAVSYDAMFMEGGKDIRERWQAERARTRRRA